VPIVHLVGDTAVAQWRFNCFWTL